MDTRFRITDMEAGAWLKDRGIVGVAFMVDDGLVDAPDLWFRSRASAARFYEEAKRRGWTAAEGVAITPGNEDAVIGELARAFGGDWWPGWTPEWGRLD